MSAEENKALVIRIAEDIWNQGNLAVVDELMAPGARYHGPHMPNGSGERDDWRSAIAMYRGAFPDAHVTFDELIATGDRIVGRWSATGTHNGELPGVAPTGRRIAINGITIYRIANDKIIEAWEQLDLLGMWQQLGVFTGPGHE
ncbi:MAG: ester cyclase [Planctomycetota bacterium]|jgi:predicted ester cyclase